MNHDVALTFYRRYLEACNARAWSELAAAVAPSVLVNGSVSTRSEYVADVQATVGAFPDYSWELRRLIVEGEWIAVHLADRGSRSSTFLGAPGDGANVETDEFDMYRIVGGEIVEVEGTADNDRLRRS